MLTDYQPIPTIPLALPPLADAAPPPFGPVLRQISILGVPITDTTRQGAIELVKNLLAQRDSSARSIFFANAHTLNLAAADASYRDVLRTADYILGDGTGVRWAARLQGVRLRENLNGTDLVPDLLRATGGRGYRCFLLGGDEPTVAAAARFAAESFAGWSLAGYHHGYLADARLTSEAVREINRVRPDLLLVGMGNPRQEQWIHQHQSELRAKVCLGVGGLLDFWAGNVRRAPRWLRALGHEWLWRLFQQPCDKARRYLLGNPLFLARVLRERWVGRCS
jgi:N-acetylglucosaminyldiphosphoundecaprenol N-acetyl-beta-D-mannosaminyltransferase